MTNTEPHHENVIGQNPRKNPNRPAPTDGWSIYLSHLTIPICARYDASASPVPQTRDCERKKPISAQPLLKLKRIGVTDLIEQDQVDR